MKRARDLTKMQQRPGVPKPDYATPAQKYRKPWNRMDKVDEVTAVTSSPPLPNPGGRRRSRSRA